MGHSRTFFNYFSLYKQTLIFLQQICVKKCPSNIRWWDSKPQPSGHESPPITTRAGLPPKFWLIFYLLLFSVTLTLCRWIMVSFCLTLYFVGRRWLLARFPGDVFQSGHRKSHHGRSGYNGFFVGRRLVIVVRVLLEATKFYGRDKTAQKIAISARHLHVVLSNLECWS